MEFLGKVASGLIDWAAAGDEATRYHSGNARAVLVAMLLISRFANARSAERRENAISLFPTVFLLTMNIR